MQIHLIGYNNAKLFYLLNGNVAVIDTPDGSMFGLPHVENLSEAEALRDRLFEETFDVSLLPFENEDQSDLPF